MLWLLPFSKPDCWPASGWPDPTGDSLPDVAGVCHPAAEGNAADASGQGSTWVSAPRRFWHKNQENPPSETSRPPVKGTQSADWLQSEHIQFQHNTNVGQTRFLIEITQVSCLRFFIHFFLHFAFIPYCQFSCTHYFIWHAIYCKQQ